MKNSIIPMLFAAVICGLSNIGASGQTVESMPPVVVKTIPEAGSKDVPAGETEIKITFSKVMADKSWSFVGPVGAAFVLIGDPAYEADHKTCVWKVKLEPGKTYAYWLNCNNFQNFRDRQGRSAVPYLLSFRTAAK